MSYVNDILNFKPESLEEEIEKAVFLKYLSAFDNVLSRENSICHLTSSGFVVNENKDKVLCIHHNIYNSWGWTGGHVDGDSDLLKVAIKEAREETGIVDIKPLKKDIISLDVLPVFGHYKNGNYIPSHIHLSVAYLLVGNEEDKLLVKADENTAVSWFTFEELMEKATEPHMVSIYKKIISKIK